MIEKSNWKAGSDRHMKGHRPVDEAALASRVVAYEEDVDLLARSEQTQIKFLRDLHQT